jgi:hypothetical protein
VWDHIHPERLIDRDGYQWTVNQGLSGQPMLKTGEPLKDPPPSMPDFVPLDWVVES